MEALNIERRESGPAFADRTSEHFDGYTRQREEDHQRAELTQLLSVAMVNGDANALCSFSNTTDWDVVHTWPLSIRQRAETLPKRAQTLAEIMFDATDIPAGPTMTEVMQLVLNACKSTDFDLAMQAGELRDRMLQKWVDSKVGA